MGQKPLSSSGKTGLALHGSMVGMTPARAVTSHLRKRYLEKYHGRYRFARAVFVFDLALLALALGLLVLDISLAVRPLLSKPSGLDLSLRTGAMVAASVVPIEATVRATDMNAHQRVELFWHLPASVEIVRAEPPLTKDQSVVFGEVVPGTERVSRLYVRVRAISQTDISFSFSLRQDAGLWQRTETGSDVRRVTGSALTAMAALTPQRVVPGSAIPIVVSNASELAAPAVIIRLTSKNGAPSAAFSEGDEVRIGDLKPHERRMLFLDVGDDIAGRLEFAWEVQDAARTVSMQRLVVDTATDMPATLKEPIVSIPGTDSTSIEAHADAPAQLWVYHPLQVTLHDAIDRVYDLGVGDGRVFIPLQRDARSSETSWSVIPYTLRDSLLTLGKRTRGMLSTAFPFTAAARYFATTGDQLGIGPLPPRVGNITSYWIVWTIGPTGADLKQLSLAVLLPNNVEATGKFASSVAGDFSADGSSVRWKIPSLPATGDTPSTFAFEIRYRPTVNDRGKIPMLIQKSVADAIEVRSGLSLHAEAGPQDANLDHDAQAKGKGKVE